MKSIAFTHLLRAALLIVAFAACDKPAPAPPPPEAAPPAPAAPAAPSFAGSYSGTWSAVDDPKDHGTSQWRISEVGVLTGLDHDDVANTSDRLSGTVDTVGNITIMAAPEDGSAAAHLTGTLRVESPTRLTSVLLWDGKPPTKYNYTLTRAQ